MKKSFLKNDRPLLTAMICCATPKECIEKIGLSLAEGAEAIGVQLEWLKREYRTKTNLKKIFDACGDAPIYVTSYRDGESRGLGDDLLGDLLVDAISSGADMADVMGDIYDERPNFDLSITYMSVGRQILLIQRIHRLGGEVMISCRLNREYSIPEYEMLASDQVTRGADLLGIFNRSEKRLNASDYVKAVDRISKTLGKRLQLEICGAPLSEISSAGGLIMHRCVQSHGEFDDARLPLLKDIKALRDREG